MRADNRKEWLVTTAPKLEEPMESMTPQEREDAKKFLVFLSILAIVGAIVAIFLKRN